jgi:phage baseplate assembly protein W
MTAKWFGYSFPFYGGKTASGSPTKVLPRQEDYKLVKNDFLLGLMTITGERWFRPTFGGDIYRTIFNQNDSNSQIELQNNIIAFANKYHPMIKVSRVEVSTIDTNENAINVKVFGKYDLDASNSEKLIVEFILPTAG